MVCIIILEKYGANVQCEEGLVIPNSAARAFILYMQVIEETSIPIQVGLQTSSN